MTQVAVFPAADADIVTVSSFSISFTANTILPFSSTVIISGLSEVQVTTVPPPLKYQMVCQLRKAPEELHR